VLILGVGLAVVAVRVGLPILVAFLGLGMLLGSDGPGGIAFDDADLARIVGTIGLVAILWEGGLTTSWRDVRTVAVPAAVLSTLGVALTAGVVGIAAYQLFDVSLVEAMILGAVVGSTDAAAVFATLRATTLRRRLASLLEAESGLNDPMAVALTLGLITWATTDGYGGLDLAGAVVWKLVAGLVVGLALARIAVWCLTRIPAAVASFSPILSVALASVAFGLPELLGGSGFLAVYIVAMAVGNTASPIRRPLIAFHEGLAFLAQITLFVVLGLLVFPSQLGAVALSGLLLTGVLVLIARPLAVWVCTIGMRFTTAERLLVSWAGLRGAVPIVLATFALSEGVGASSTIFNAVFFVVLLSAAIQGPLLLPLARRLGCAGEDRLFYVPPLEVGAVGGADILEFDVEPGDRPDGTFVRDLGVPRTALLAVVLRDGQAIPPRGSTEIRAGDRLYVLTRTEHLGDLERLMGSWRRHDART